MHRRVLLLAPLGGAALAGIGFMAMLRRMETGTFDPRGVPSMLLGKPVPRFDLPGFGSGDIAAAGHPVLLNFFASWCAPCVEEAPALMAMRQAGMPLWGIAYKDRVAATTAFLGRTGNPFASIARDDAGLTAIDFGVTGVPETFLIDAAGLVRWHFSGPLTAMPLADIAALLKRYA